VPPSGHAGFARASAWADRFDAPESTAYVLVLHHRDEPEQGRAHHKVGAFGAAGLSIHSLMDGLGIGLAFHVSTATGLLVFIAVVSHDFADGMNTVSFVLFQSDDRRQALGWLSADALAPLVGAVIGSLVAIWSATSATCSRSMRGSSCRWGRRT
jgi:zinc transporter ZupT